MESGNPKYPPLEYKSSHNTVKHSVEGLPSIMMEEIVPNYLPGWHLWSNETLYL